jgi:hypothetical protein
MNLIQSGFSECEIRAVLPVGNSKINPLCQVLQDGNDTLHTHRPPCVLAHAFHDIDLDMIKVGVESWEVEDSFLYVHSCLKQYLLDPKFTFMKFY